MSSIEDLRNSLPEVAKDIRVNLQTVLDVATLTPAQKWGVAAACAVASRNAQLRDAVLAEARAQAGDAVVEDARAAAVLMGMNNVYYRFRHVVGKPEYAEKPARLRMQRLVKPETSRLDFELLCLAVSAVNNCETCVRSHEQAVVEGGLSSDAVHDAVRIAAVIQATAVALEA
jgi:lipoyl-dependent peroxiredoxin subunit D